MDKIAILGPKGTFSHFAADTYLKENALEMTKVFYRTIDEAFHSVGKECGYAIIPIENTLDGYVQRTLDLLMEMDIEIISEIMFPVQFSMMANIDDISQLKRLYVQFKANGQCRKYIESLHKVEISSTNSNMESYNRVMEGLQGEGGIVPIYAERRDARYCDENVTDFEENYTRFIVVKPGNGAIPKSPAGAGKIKIPLFVSPQEDRPGMLFDILSSFSEKSINLVSIMSRPTKKVMGTYHFYMEIDADTRDYDKIAQAAASIDSKYNLKILGIYLV